MKTDLKYIKRQKDRQGRECVYVRVSGRKVRLRAPEGSVDFEVEYYAALASVRKITRKIAVAAAPAPSKTFRWLVREFATSAEFRRLDRQSQTTRLAIYESCLAEPLRRGSTERMGDCPLADFSADHIRVLRDRKRDKPGAANNRKKYLGSLFAWAGERGLWKLANPARDVKPLEYASEGFHTWTEEEMAAFEAHHAIGTRARLAFALMRYTGVRRGDVVKLGEQHITDEVLSFIPSKTRYKRAEPLVLPVLPELRAIIRATPSVGIKTFLVTPDGEPYSRAGFGNWFRDRCNEAGLPQCSAHGIRKATATMAAENGATDRQLMAMFGWTTAGQANAYTMAASRKHMAAQAVNLVANKRGTDRVRLVGKRGPF